VMSAKSAPVKGEALKQANVAVPIINDSLDAAYNEGRNDSYPQKLGLCDDSSFDSNQCTLPTCRAQTWTTRLDFKS